MDNNKIKLLCKIIVLILIIILILYLFKCSRPEQGDAPTNTSDRPQDVSRNCPSDAYVADVVAIDHPMVFNRLGAQNVNWTMYALRHDVIDLSSKKPLNYGSEGQTRFQHAKSNNESRNIALRSDLRPRPLVLRVPAGQYLKVNFTNLLHAKSLSAPSPSPDWPPKNQANPFDSFPNPLPGVDNPDHPMEHAVKDKLGTADKKKIFRLDDQVASRYAGFHPQGLEAYSTVEDTSSNVGKNNISLAAPGQTQEYCFYAAHEGAYLVASDGAAFGGEGTAGNSGVGLFGAVIVEPEGARFYRGQVTEEELRLATTGTTATKNQPVINYETHFNCADPRISGSGWCQQEQKDGLPVLNMVRGKRIIHGDINAIIVGPGKDNPNDGHFPKSTYPLEKEGKQNPALPNRLEPFREFVSIFHDENAATQAFPYFFEHPELRHTLHGVRDGFMINYGSGGVGAEIIANRLHAGPMQDCIDCAYEEFFLSSFAVGDAAMLVDKPANLVIAHCQPEFLANPASEEFKKNCIQPADLQASNVFYPHDPANVHHSYIGDFVKFRNMHSGKEQHIFHLHNHQWLYNPNDDNSNYIDAQGIGPGSGYTYEIAYGGSGNRNKTVGDAIFHCHYYPHFAQGMWYLWRNHDVFEAGTPLAVSQNASHYHQKPYDLQFGKPADNVRALPDGEIEKGTPIPAVVPLPGKGMALMPAEVVVKPRTGLLDGLNHGSTAEVKPNDKQPNPGYPFFIAGVANLSGEPVKTSVGSRPTTPPLDMSEIPGVVSGHNGGLPRHTLAGYSAGSEDEWELSRFSAAKHIESAMPVYFPEEGTALEKIAMDFHSVREHDSFKLDMLGNISGNDKFITNGNQPIPGAPYSDPCIDDNGDLLRTNQDAKFFGGNPGSMISAITPATPNGIEFGANSPRVYKGANLQLDVVFNKVGYHYPQQRILTLWEDVPALLSKTKRKPPEPLVLRMNTFDCAMYAHTNLVPKEFFMDDYQIKTPTDVIGQHIHLPKWDLPSADGSANGWNYEDGTFAPGEVLARISAINKWNAEHPAQAVSPILGSNPLKPKAHPYFGVEILSVDPSLQWTEQVCLDKWNEVNGDVTEFQNKHYDDTSHCNWFGARTTLQRWFSDPLVNVAGIHRGLGITFTHDHLGPSTHQQLGLYATMLTEPPGSEWKHNENGQMLYTRLDGGPTSWQAVITNKGGTPLYLDDEGKLPTEKDDDSHREFFLQFGDFQHAYLKDKYVGVDVNGNEINIDANGNHKIDEGEPDSETFRASINPSVRKPSNPQFPDIIAYEPKCPGGSKGDPEHPTRLYGAVYDITPKPAPPRPCPEAISADDIGMMVVNYRNEPIGLRVYDPERLAGDGKKGNQANGFKGDMAFAMQTRTDRAIADLNTQLGSTPYPALTNGVLAGDPFTPIMRAYSGDAVKVKIQGGSHEHEHNATVNGIRWTQGGSGFGEAPHSGWRNAQNAGLSEQFTFTSSITDYHHDISEPELSDYDRYYKKEYLTLTDRLYAVDTSQDGLWNGVWGVLRTSNILQPGTLTPLPSNQKPTVIALDEPNSNANQCPKNAKKRSYEVTAVLANQALDNTLGVTISAAPERASLNSSGGTLVYNPRPTKISINNYDEDSKDIRLQHIGDGPLNDPTAILFIRTRDLNADNKLKPGRPLEPIVLRASAGECIELKLNNALPKDANLMADLDGFTSLSGIAIREKGNPGSKMTSFNNNLIRPSNHIGLHPQLVHYNVHTSEGNNVGINQVSTVKPGEFKVYHWYAGTLNAKGAGIICEKSDSSPQTSSLAIRKAEIINNLSNVIVSEQKKFTKGLVLPPTDIAKTLSNNPNLNTCLTRIQNSGDGLNTVGSLNSNFKSLDAQQTVEEDLLLPDNKPQFVDKARFVEQINDTHQQISTRDQISCVNKSLEEQKMPKISPDILTRALVPPVTRAIKLDVNTNWVKIDQADLSPVNRQRFTQPELKTRELQLKSATKSDPEACRFLPVEFGGTNLTPPDRIKQGQKGAVGALIVEPKDASWIAYNDDKVIDRQNPGNNQQNKRASRATATVSYKSVDKGKVVDRSFRDFAFVHQKGLNFRYKDGNAVANLAAEKEGAGEDPMTTAPEDAHDSGHMAINYGSEPLWFRFGLPPDAPFGKEGFGGIHNAWEAFSNKCCTNGGTAISANANVGEPYTPIVTALAGHEMRIRALLPTGSGRGTTVELYGHGWPRDPYLAEIVDETTSGSFPHRSRPFDWKAPANCLGHNALGMTLGGQDSITPMAHYDLLFPQAGGKHYIPGDYLWRDHASFGLTNGLWALVRVEENAGAMSPEMLRHNCQ